MPANWDKFREDVTKYAIATAFAFAFTILTMLANTFNPVRVDFPTPPTQPITVFIAPQDIHEVK